MRELAGHPEFIRLVKHADQECPQIVPWNGKNDPDEWKRSSAMRDGFELAMQIFSPGWKPK